MVKKLDCWENEEGGEELKVPHYASAAAARDSNLPHHDGNLPYIIATCFYSQH